MYFTLALRLRFDQGLRVQSRGDADRGDNQRASVPIIIVIN